MSAPLGRVSIIGQGYVGLPLAMAAVKAGWDVTGIDISPNTVESLSSGRSHIEDVSDLELSKAISQGAYRATTSGKGASKSDISVICVPTPLDKKGLPDLTYLKSAVTLIAAELKSDALLISESTSYPGTVRDLVAPLVASLRADSAASISFASAPERVDPRNSTWNMGNTPRLVAGLDELASKRALDFYSSICEKVIPVSKPEVAEMAKLLENTFRQVNIALVNQLLPLCKEHLLWKARQVGHELPFIAQADEINGAMPKYVVERLLELATPDKGSHITILGVAYKAGISDVRESPAENVAKELLARGLNPLWIDPLVESFHNFEGHSGQVLAGAIVVTAQEGLAVNELANSGVPILDCTGAFKGISGVEQL